MSARSLALIAALLICPPGFGRQAPGPAAQAGGSEQKHVGISLISLPTAGAGRGSPTRSATRASPRYPWLAGMRREGIRLAIITFGFHWARHGRKLTGWRVTNEQYFPGPRAMDQITDALRLASIRTSGLEGELEKAALPHAKAVPWFEWPRRRSGDGYVQVYFADSEQSPVRPSSWLGQYPQGATPLMRASMLGDVGRVKTLVAEGAEVDAAGRGGTTALSWAAASGTPAAVQALLDAGAHVNLNPGRTGDALVAATANNRPDNVEVLLKAGADPNSKNSEGESVFQIAARHRYANIVRLLLQAGARR